MVFDFELNVLEWVVEILILFKAFIAEVPNNFAVADGAATCIKQTNPECAIFAQGIGVLENEIADGFANTCHFRCEVFPGEVLETEEEGTCEKVARDMFIRLDLFRVKLGG